ncbi:putative ribonuclease H-like domain-containing protein [Tanacetum coccineum]
MNKLVRGNLVRGLPSKIFKNDHSCVACQKGKQHKASCKAKLVNSISKPLHMLHMDLFGPINVKSLMKKSYCLVVTDDFSRFSWVFFLATKDETSGILKTFITKIENQLDYKVKVIRSDNGTEFKNSVMNQFCEMKGIKREFSIARTPQQNGVAERRNRTLIEAARTMLVDSKLPTTFWAEAVNTACYVLNRVLVIKPHNKTPYELIRGRTPLIDFMKPFGCPVTILNTRDHLGKFDGKADEGFFVGYSMVSKAMRVFNKRTRIVEDTLNIRFIKNAPNVTGNGPDWIFDVDSLTISMNYVPVVAGNQKLVDSEEDVGVKPTELDESEALDKDGKGDQDTGSKFERLLQLEKQPNSTISFNTVGTPVSAAGPSFTNDDLSSPVNAAEASNAFEEHLFKRFSPFKNAFTLPPVSNVTPMDDIGIFGNAYDDEYVGAEADLNNLETTMNVSPIPTTRIDKDHPKDQIIGDLNLAIQTRRMTKIYDEHAMIEAMQEELLQFQLQKVWTLVNLPNGKRAIRTKWVFRNKKYERGIVIRNKARLVAQGYTQEECIDYDEVFAHVSRIEAIRLFLAYTLFMGFIVHQMDVKSAFLYGTIEEEKEDGIFISQDKYVAEILKKFDFATVKTASTPIETNKALVKDEEAEAVDVHLYRSMIGSLMYLTASRPDIMFAVCACARFQVTPKMSHLHAVKRIFRYLKGQPKLGLWYPRDSPFDLEAFSDSDYAGASLDRKSTTGGCQFLGKRLISWQCKKQTIVANSTTEAEYVAAANCYGQVLWIQNQMLDYGFNFMNTKIYIDNESTICIVKNPVFHSKTKHIEIRHHFIRDSYEKKLIQVIKIHTDHNVADLLTKAFDVSRKAKRTTEISQSSRPIHLVADETIYKEWEDRMERAATTASSLEAEQDSVNSVKKIHAIVDGKAVVISESSVRNELLFDDEDDITCLTNDDIFENLALMGQSKGFSGKVTPLFDSMLVQNHAPKGEGGGDIVERAITTNASLVAAQDSDNIIRTQTTAMPNVNIPLGMDTGSSPRHQETMRGAPAQTRSERVLKQPNEPPLSEGHTSGSREGRMEHTFELMDIVLDLEKEKDAQAVEILKLKQRVKKLERRRKSSILYPRRRIYRQVEPSDDDLDEEDASKQGRTTDKTKPMFKDSDFDDLDDLVDEGMAFKAKAKGVAIKDVEDSSRPIRSITNLQPLPTIDPKDKGKGILQETEPVEKTKKKVQGDAQIERDALAELDRAQKEKQKQEKATNPMDSEEDGSNTKKDGKRIKRIADSTSKQKLPKKSKVIKEQESAESNAEAATDYEQEKEELRMWLAVILDEDETVDPELLSVKLVMKRFKDNTPEGYNLLLWGDFNVMFKPNAEDEIWSNQQDWTLIS